MKEKGFHADRLKRSRYNLREVAFAKQWDEEHNPDARRTIIDHLIPDCTERDRKVAATIVQWLGSNVGMSFIVEASKLSPKIGEYLKRYL